MPVGIGRRRTAQHRIAKRSIGAQYGVENLQTPTSWLTAGSATFQVPKSGYWKFHAWGPGGRGHLGSGFYGGGSGAYLEVTKALQAGQAVSLIVGTENSTDTMITLPDGSVCTAGQGFGDVSGSGGLGGTASGGDVNINGSQGGGSATAGGNGGGTAGGTGGGTSGGAGAPGNAGFPGGRGGTTTHPNSSGYTPGGGGAAGAAGSLITGRGGGAMIVAYFLRE